MKQQAAFTRRETGLSLIEIMIALALGLMLLAGIYQIYLSSVRSYALAEGLTGRQEAIRYVSTVLSRDVRGAGYRGCLPDTGQILNTVNPNPATSGGTRTNFTQTDFRYQFERYVEGFDGQVGGGWNPPLPTLAPALTGVAQGTDVLTLRAAFYPEVYIVQQMPTPAAAMHAGPVNPPPLATGDIAMVTDCAGATIFQISEFNPNGANFTITHNAGQGGGLPAPGNWTANLGRTYPVGSQILRIATVTYFVRNGSLWRREEGANPVERAIADGVEHMQLLYGVDNDGDQVPDQYVAASAIAGGTVGWRTVVSVRVALLVAGVRDRAGEADGRDYDLLGTTVTPPSDGRLRRVVTMTLSLRNRLP